MRVFSKEGEGGCKKLIELAYAWIYSGNTSKAIVLFDKDKAGISAKMNLLKAQYIEIKDQQQLFR